MASAEIKTQQAPSSGESCTADYFQGSYNQDDYILEEKVRTWWVPLSQGVGYVEVG